MAWDKLKPAANRDFLLAVGDIRANNAAIQVVLGATRLTNGTPITALIPLGGKTKMAFYMAAPPVGWTEIANIGDVLMSVKGGTVYTKGGEVKGSWSVPEHVLTSAEMAAHTHTYTLAVSTTSVSTGGNLVSQSAIAAVSGSTGGGKGHTEGTSWRPAARVCIIASKD